jgi:hypothetical protein
MALIYWPTNEPDLSGELNHQGHDEHEGGNDLNGTAIEQGKTVTRRSEAP